jgi:hypothetical protein
MSRRSHNKKPLLRFADLAELDARKEDSRRVTYRDLLALSKGPEDFPSDTAQPKLVNTANNAVNNEASDVNKKGPVVNKVASDVNNVSRAISASRDLSAKSDPIPAGKISRHLLGVRIPLVLLDQLDFWCDQKRVSKQTAVEFALRELIEGRVDLVNNASNASSALSMIMINDVEGEGLDSGLHPSIINIINHYERVTRNKAKPADIEIAKTLADYSPLAVECGILLAQLRPKPGRINSLRYCTSVIDEVVANYGTQLEAYAEYLRRKFQAQGRSSKTLIETDGEA